MKRSLMNATSGLCDGHSTLAVCAPTLQENLQILMIVVGGISWTHQDVHTNSWIC